MITASKVPAILGVSRFTSQFAIWHEMAGLVEPRELDADRMAWGHIAEHSLAQWWLHKHDGWQLNTRRRGVAEIAYTHPGLPFANVATIDRRAINRTVGVNDPARFRILECKTAMTLDDWGRPGEDDAIPADYYAQVLFQMGVSGIHQASVVVLGPFSEPEIHDVELDQQQFDQMVDQLALWEASLALGTPPDLDDSLSTYETVRGLHPDIDRDGEVEITVEEAVRLLDMVTAEDDAKRAAREAKITAADLMGSARLLTCGGVKIADRRAKTGAAPYVQFNKKADLSEVAERNTHV